MKLTESNLEARAEALVLSFMGEKVTHKEIRAFNAGFNAGFDSQQKKIDTYAKFLAGEITRQALDEVLNEIS